MITTRSLDSRSSFGDFPSNSSSVSLSSDKEIVNLACVTLRRLPIEIQSLDLSTNTRKPRRPLKHLRALSELTNLVHLDLALSEMTNLVHLDLSGNAVERLDGLQIFTQLQTLAIPRNHLKTLSTPLFVLKGLTHLDLSGNFITHLPRAFSGLKLLEDLNLSGNNLGTMGEVDVLAPLSNLLSCSLAANPFCRLPTYKDYVICKIRSLERLDDVEISRVARDRAAKRFSSAIFSQDACLREAGRAHEDEQNRLLEAQSALEAENLRLKGELQVKSKLLQNKSRAWSSATEQLLQLQQEVAMLNLDRRRSALSTDHDPSEAELIAVSIAARHNSSYSNHQRPQSAPSPKRRLERQRESFSYRDIQLDHILDGEDDGEQTIGSQEVEDKDNEDHIEFRNTEDDKERIAESRDAACMPMSPVRTEVLKRSTTKMLVDASCSPLRIIPPAIITKFDQKEQEDDDVSCAGGEYKPDEAERLDYEDVSSPPQTWDREEMSRLTRTTPPTSRSSSSRQQRDRTPGRDQVRRVLSQMDENADSTQRATRPRSTSLDYDLKEDESFRIPLPSGNRSRFPTFEDDTACPAYEDTQNPILQTRSSSASALSSRKVNVSNGPVLNTSSLGSHSLPPSPAKSPSKMREWYRKQNELRLMTPPPSPPKKSPYKPRRSAVEASPLAPFVDKDVLAQQIQALQSCKQSLLAEIRNEEHLVHVLKQESAQYADQIDCLSVNIQACLDGDPSAIRFSFSPPGSPRRRSKKLHEEETGRARLEILRNKLRFAEDKEKEIETTMVRMTKRVLHDDLNPADGKANIREKFSPVNSLKRSDAPFDKEIFALTHKLQLVIVEKEEIHMQMSQLMAQLRGQSTAERNLGDDDGSGGEMNFKQAKSLAKSRQMADELRTRHREVTERIVLKEKHIASLLEELKEVEAELKQISSLNTTSVLSPLFQRERTASMEFLQTMRSQRGSNGIANNSQLTTATSGKLAVKEILNPNVFDEIKADIFKKLSQQLSSSTETSEDETNKSRADLHQAIASALETHLQLGTNATHLSQDVNGYQLGNSQQNCTEDGENSANVMASAESPATDEVCCGRFDEFAQVETYYARKYMMAKDRVSTFMTSMSDNEGNTNSQMHIASAQRILKICERLEAAETKSKFDPVSKIEVDQQGNSRGSLKIILLAARDLPTSHLRTKNLDPYVCFEVVYPSHAIPSSSNANSMVGRVFRSQTKKKSIYPVWDEDFEIAPILSLNGYLHVRILNDRRLSREQLVGEARIPLQTLIHQKRIVEWFSLGLNVPPASGSVVSKICGGAIRLQLQLYFSSVERYKCVVDELVARYLHDHNQLPSFIDAVGDCDRPEESFPTEQPEQNTTDSPIQTPHNTEPISYDQRRQLDVGSHFPLDELATSLPSYKINQNSTKNVRVRETSVQSNKSTRVHDNSHNSTTQLSPERRRSLWDSKTSKATAATIDDTKPYFGFSGTMERSKQSTTSFSGVVRRSQTPTAQSKKMRNAAALQHHALRRKSVETPECFDEYSPYHPGFKSVDIIDGSNNEVGGTRNGRIMARISDRNRKTDLSIFKSPSLTRRPPSSGFPERYIGLDNQTCERLKRIFGRMDGTSTS
ncbi:hypothetical protein PHMEG_0009521 [Phytophthora megakarya]|uniref:C2 domain-containing protein n=1 Tax=Phytophthora megakarya TaxID=4795 RepID=A0A225WHT1_9STRA|nr:hypothetical protein PHMEG_0009521 [Phytophthora megakarya]